MRFGTKNSNEAPQQKTRVQREESKTRLSDLPKSTEYGILFYNNRRLLGGGGPRLRPGRRNW